MALRSFGVMTLVRDVIEFDAADLNARVNLIR
jgi:hypothetical protein